MGQSVFRVRKMQFKLIPVFPWTVLGVTGQTPFTYLAHVMDLNFIRGVGEKTCFPLAATDRQEPSLLKTIEDDQVRPCL